MSSFSLLPSVAFVGCTVAFEKGLTECGSSVYALSCLICK